MQRIVFHTQFEKHEGNGTKTWRTVDNALNRKARRTTPDVISIDNHLCTSEPKIADELNNYLLITICANNIIPNIPTPYTHYLTLVGPCATFVDFPNISVWTVCNFC